MAASVPAFLHACVLTAPGQPCHYCLSAAVSARSPSCLRASLLQEYAISSDEALSLEDMPQRVVVVGSG